MLAIILFSIEYHLYIKKNVMTQTELESGWVSTNRAQLSWSYYIMIASASLILINLILIKLTVRINQSIGKNLNRSVSLSGPCLSKNSILNLSNQDETLVDSEPFKQGIARGGSFKSSKKIKRMIDLVY